MGVWFLVGMLVLVIFPYWIVRKFVLPMSLKEITRDFTLRNQLIRLRVVATTSTNDDNDDHDEDNNEKITNNNDEAKKSKKNDDEEEMKENNKDSTEREEESIIKQEGHDADDEESRDNNNNSESKKVPSKNRNETNDKSSKNNSNNQKITKISWSAFPRPISSPHLRMILVFAVSTGLSLILVGIIVAAWQVAPYKVCALYYSSTTEIPTKITFGIESEVYTSQFSLRSLQLLFRYNSVLQLMRLSSNWFEIVGVFGTTSQAKCF